MSLAGCVIAPHNDGAQAKTVEEFEKGSRRMDCFLNKAQRLDIISALKSTNAAVCWCKFVRESWCCLAWTFPQACEVASCLSGP